MAAMTTATAASSFIGTRLPEVNAGSGRVQMRFGFGKKTAAPKKAAKKSVSNDRPLWFPGATAPDWLDGSLVGDYGFDPFGLGKPAEYLQYDYDSLDQNLAKNLAGDVIGTRFETSEVQSTPFQPYAEVFGLQRFRECELIHGRWAMLATLGALSVEWLTGITWQDAGKVRVPFRAGAWSCMENEMIMAFLRKTKKIFFFLKFKSFIILFYSYSLSIILF